MDGGGRDEHGEMLTDAGDGRMRLALAVNAGGMASSPARLCAAARLERGGGASRDGGTQGGGGQGQLGHRGARVGAGRAHGLGPGRKG
jgi:hypothetical protein